MRKFFTTFLISSLFFNLLSPLAVFAETSPKVLLSPENTKTYISSVEEYKEAILNPELTVLVFLESLDLSDLTENKIIIDGYDRIFSFKNKSLTISETSAFTVDYKTDNSLIFQYTVANYVRINQTSSFPTFTLSSPTTFSPKLYFICQTKNYVWEDDSYTPLEPAPEILAKRETVEVGNEVLTLNNPENSAKTAKFSKTSDPNIGTNYFLELTNYSGEKIKINYLPYHETFQLVLTGENVIETTSDLALEYENANLIITTADAPASLTLNVNSASSTAVGIATGFSNPLSNSEFRIDSKDVSLEINLKNQTPSDSPFLTGIFTRNGDVNLFNSSKITINVSPNLLSDNYLSTNNLTGITTNLNASTNLYRNNLLINNPKGNYSVWTGDIFFPDGVYDTDTDQYTDSYTDLTDPETKLTYASSQDSSANVENIASVQYNTDNYVVRITPYETFNEFTLNNKINLVEARFTAPAEIEVSALADALDLIKSSFSLSSLTKASLDSLEIVKSKTSDSYFLKINLLANSRYGFKSNSTFKSLYKTYFVEKEHQNSVNINNEVVETYLINSIDSMTIYYPLNVVQPEEPEEPEEPEKLETPEAPAKPDDPKEPEPTEPEISESETEEELEPVAEEAPNTSAASFSPIYYICLVFSALALLPLLGKRDDLV
ncbi:hypothetical protein IJH66_03680 [Candidatus Saccharibacteria bacterium]|nr:hypothetical protein [Candidatus Saccharibacteria bacterium]